MMQSIEVLRDGASAQYGSDAIAGVINLRLREATARAAKPASLTAGATPSYDMLTGTTAPGRCAPGRRRATLSRDVSDGETLTVSAWKGLPLGDRARSPSPPNTRIRSTPSAAAGTSASSIRWCNGAFDPREATFDRFNAWYGEPELEQKTVFVNAEYEVASGAQAVRLGELAGS